MKKLFTLLMATILSFSLVACGDSCEHNNKTISYQKGDLLNVVKTTSCADCEETIEEIDLSSVEYVYDKEVVNSNGIKVVINSLKIDGWDFITLNFTVEGTSNEARTFECTQIYVNDTDTNGWVYADNLSGGKKSKQEHLIYDEISVEDFFKEQDYKVEFTYEITSPATYDTLESSSFTFNLNEYTSIKDNE